MLCHQGTLVNALLQGGRSALHVACDMGKMDIIKFLVSKGADVNVSTKAMKSILFQLIM